MFYMGDGEKHLDRGLFVLAQCDSVSRHSVNQEFQDNKSILYVSDIYKRGYQSSDEDNTKQSK